MILAIKSVLSQAFSQLNADDDVFYASFILYFSSVNNLLNVVSRNMQSASVVSGMNNGDVMADTSEYACSYCGLCDPACVVKVSS